jgi:hypothetical protein
MAWMLKLLEGDDMAIKTFPPRECWLAFFFFLPYLSFFRYGDDSFQKQLKRKETPNFSITEYFVYVDDAARLHIAALLAAPYNWTDVVSVLRKLRPGITKIPNPPADEKRDLTDVRPRKRAEELLKSFFGRPGWTSLEESIATAM